MIVYIFNAEDTWLYKVGHTKSDTSKNRLKQCQTGNPSKISIILEYSTPYAKEIEKMLHRSYSHCRQAGEWFLFDNISINDIKNKIIKYEEVVTLLKNENSN